MELALLGHYILRVLGRIHEEGDGLRGSSLIGKSISDTVQSFKDKNIHFTF